MNFSTIITFPLMGGKNTMHKYQMGLFVVLFWLITFKKYKSKQLRSWSLKSIFNFLLRNLESGVHHRRRDGAERRRREDGPHWRGTRQTAGQTPAGQGQQPAYQRLG